MSYKVLLSKATEKFLDRLKGKNYSRLAKAIFDLEENPFPRGIKMMKDPKFPQYRLRVGDYRVLYDVGTKEKIVFILKVGDRKDIYR